PRTRGRRGWWWSGGTRGASSWLASVRRSRCAHYTIARGRSLHMSTHPALELSHTALSEEDALRFLDGHRIRLGERTMDPKAQIVVEFVKSIRKPGYFPQLHELRQ